MPVKLYYIFSLTDPRDGRPYYFGSTAYPRQIKAQHCQIMSKPTPRLRARLEAILATGYRPEFSILSSTQDPDEATKRVQELIDTSRADGYELLNDHKAHRQKKSMGKGQQVFTENQYMQAFDRVTRNWIEYYGHKKETGKIVL